MQIEHATCTIPSAYCTCHLHFETLIYTRIFPFLHFTSLSVPIKLFEVQMASAICTSEGANPSAICSCNSAIEVQFSLRIVQIKMQIAPRFAQSKCKLRWVEVQFCTWTVGFEVQIDPLKKEQPSHLLKPANLTPSKWPPQNTSIRGI